MPNVVMLNVIMLGVVMLSVMAPSTVVEHSTHKSKTEGLNPSTDTETEKMMKKSFITSLPLVLIMQGLEFYIKSN
jgi:hypothetical protein